MLPHSSAKKESHFNIFLEVEETQISHPHAQALPSRWTPLKSPLYVSVYLVLEPQDPALLGDLTSAEHWSRISAWPCCCDYASASQDSGIALLPRYTTSSREEIAASQELAASQCLFCRGTSSQWALGCPTAGVSPFQDFGKLHK